MRAVVFDVETDSLNPTAVWCLCAYDINEGKMYSFVRPDKSNDAFRKFAKGVDLWIAHNGIEFDLWVVNKLIGQNIIPDERLRDTLILSWMYRYERPEGHSLDSWGIELGYPKIGFNDFSKFSLEMLAYCKQDVMITVALYKYLMSRLKNNVPERAIQCEHQSALLLRRMHENGFPYDNETAKKLEAEVSGILATLDSEISKSFPPKSRPVLPTFVKETKEGKAHKANLKWYSGCIDTDFIPGTYFSRLHYDTFNPGSVKQVVEKFHEAGWKPVDKTDTHRNLEKSRPSTKEESALKKEKLAHFKKYGWKVNETNAGTLPDTAPQGARLLVERMLHASRLRTLTEWREAYDEKDGRIHGRCQTIGTWTHRASHRNPNTANIAAEKSLKYSSDKLSELAKQYGRRMRSLWCAGRGHMLVGTDAEGIQLRVLAHYLGDKGYADAIVNGVKELGTDVHSVNKQVLGAVCSSRDTAKTFIYALLLGAGVAKIASILNCSTQAATDARDRFIAATPGFAELKGKVIPRDAARGYFIGFDGRRIRCDSEHLMLAGYLQAGEAIVMKYAMCKWHEELENQGIWFKLVNFVHDEWQTLIHDDEDIAKRVGKIQADAITWAGEYLGVKCPLAGSFSYGKNWYETH